jgi:hypothetical protein
MTYFSILFAVAFASIGFLCLALIHLSENYQRKDFATASALWKKLKKEPKWFLASAALSPILALTTTIIARTSNRYDEVATNKLDPFDRIAQQLQYYMNNILELKLGYDDKQIAFFVIILLCPFGVLLYSKWRDGTWKIAHKALKRFGFLCSAVLLFSFFIFALLYITSASSFSTWSFMMRFVFITGILGLGFYFLQKRVTMPLMALLFFIFSFGAVRAISTLEKDNKNQYLPGQTLKNSYYLHNQAKMAVNLAYTFNCYGEDKTPFYYPHGKEHIFTIFKIQHEKTYPRKTYLGRIKYAAWNKVMLRMTKAQRTWRYKNAKHEEPTPNTIFYYEPSINKINAQLARLQRTKTWRCARIKNDIYRIEKIDY